MLLQVTFDVPYLPGGYRHYDYSALANIVDFMFIMAYDEAYGDLIAWANCPLSQTAKGAFFDSKPSLKKTGGIMDIKLTMHFHSSVLVSFR